MRAFINVVLAFIFSALVILILSVTSASSMERRVLFEQGNQSVSINLHPDGGLSCSYMATTSRAIFLMTGYEAGHIAVGFLFPRISVPPVDYFYFSVAGYDWELRFTEVTRLEGGGSAVFQNGMDGTNAYNLATHIQQGMSIRVPFTDGETVMIPLQYSREAIDVLTECFRGIDSDPA